MNVSINPKKKGAAISQMRFILLMVALVFAINSLSFPQRMITQSFEIEILSTRPANVPTKPAKFMITKIMKNLALS